MKKRANESDLIIAQRIRAARKEAGISQTEAANGLNVTFQQLQKYECGKNRISCGKLALFAKTVGKPISWFFNDIEEFKILGEDLGAQVIGSTQGPEMARAFLAIQSTEKRTLLVQLAKTMA